MEHLINVVQSNGVAAAGVAFAAGVAAANVPLIVQKVVQLLAPWIRKHPQVADAIVDCLQKDVHAVADTPVPVAPPPPAA